MLILPTNKTKLQSVILFFSLFTLTAIVILFLARNHITDNIYPGGDLAADMLLANKIDNEGFLLTGQYSRYKFNHPGPFFFYVNYIAENLFEGSSISRASSWTISTAIINAIFLTLAAALAQRAIFHKSTFISQSVFILLSLTILENALTSEWTPHRLITPYLAYIFCLLLLAKGEIKFLPVSVLIASILIHGYITLIILTLPMLAACFFYAIRYQQYRLSRNDKLYTLLSAGIGLIFLSPIILDFLFNTPNNIQKIILSLNVISKADTSGIQEVSAFTLTILKRNVTLIQLSFPLLCSIMFFSEIRKSRSIRIFLSIVFSICLLFFLYHSSSPTPLYDFIGLYLSAISISVITISALFLIDSSSKIRHKKRKIFVTGALITLILVSISPLVSLQLEPKKPHRGTHIYNAAKAIQDRLPRSDRIIISYSSHSMWPFVAGLLLELNNNNINACTVQRNMAFLYTPKMICGEGSVRNIHIIENKECLKQCFFSSNNFGLQSSFSEFEFGKKYRHTSTVLIFDGWSAAEPNFRWSEGNHSRIYFRAVRNTPPIKGTMELLLHAYGQQSIELLLNGKAAGNFILTGQEKKVTVSFDPANLKLEAINILEFRFSNATAPNNGDPRVLAMAIKDITIN